MSHKNNIKPKPQEVFWYELEFEGWTILILTAILLIAPIFLVWFVRAIIWISHSKLQWF